MKYFAAHALLNLGGNENPSASDIENCLRNSGVHNDK